MNYLAEIIAFERWLENNYLTRDAQLLWYRLMYQANKCNWPEWVTVDNLRLMAAMQMSREATFIKVRDDLLKAGLIEYQKGKKGSPNKYRLIPFAFRNVVKSEVETVVNQVVKSEVETVVQEVVETVDIRDKNELGQAMEKLAKYEDIEEQKIKAEKLRPDFPVLRNNNQRKEFLKGFHDWEVWFTVPEAEETYYRYNLPDGSSIVICEYNRWLFWKFQYTDENPESRETRLYLLRKGYHYLNDCRASETDIVDHLKNVQKGLK